MSGSQLYRNANFLTMDVQALIEKFESGTLAPEEQLQFLKALGTDLEKLKTEHPAVYLQFITSLSETMDAISAGLEEGGSDA